MSQLPDLKAILKFLKEKMHDGPGKNEKVKPSGEKHKSNMPKPSKPAAKAAIKPYVKPVEKSAEKPADLPADKPSEESKDLTASDKPTERPTED